MTLVLVDGMLFVVVFHPTHRSTSDFNPSGCIISGMPLGFRLSRETVLVSANSVPLAKMAMLLARTADSQTSSRDVLVVE